MGVKHSKSKVATNTKMATADDDFLAFQKCFLDAVDTLAKGAISQTVSTQHGLLEVTDAFMEKMFPEDAFITYYQEEFDPLCGPYQRQCRRLIQSNEFVGGSLVLRGITSRLWYDNIHTQKKLRQIFAC